MTLNDLYTLYEHNGFNDRTIVLCHWKTQEGVEINNLEQFKEILEQNDTIYLMNEVDSDKFHYFEYFIMQKAATPYLVAVRHPMHTNAFYKELPDKFLDMFTADNGGIYRFLEINYGNNLKEYVIECPPKLSDNIAEFCKSRFPKGFLNTRRAKNSSMSLVFTNTSRYIDLGADNFVLYDLKDVYPEWDIKRITTLNLSRKVWNDLKRLQ